MNTVRDIGLSAIMYGLETMGVKLNPRTVRRIEIGDGKLTITTFVLDDSKKKIFSGEGTPLYDVQEYRIVNDTGRTDS